MARTIRCVVLLVIGVCVVLPASLAFAQGCRLSLLAEWTLRDGSPYLIIDGAINGEPVGVILDTGAHGSSILASAAIRLQLPRSEARGHESIGIGGAAKSDVAQVEHLKIGKAEVPTMALRVVDHHDRPGHDILLGQDFLSKFDVEFDLKDRKVRLHRAQNCRDLPLAYWTKDAPGQVELEQITDMQRMVAFTVSLNGTKVPAFLDSGAPMSIVPAIQAQAVGVVPGGEGVTGHALLGGIGSKKVDSWVGTFKEFAIGNESIPDVRLRFADLWVHATYESTGTRIRRNAAQEHPMIVGADFLRSHRVFVVNSQRRMYYTYDGGPVFRPE